MTVRENETVEGRRDTSSVPSGAAAFLAGVAQAARPSEHPYNGMDFYRCGMAVCQVILTEAGSREVEISGMYAPVRRGGRHAMSFLALLADIHGITLRLTASSIIVSRMDTAALVDWYRHFGFLDGPEDEHGRMPMVRPPVPLLPGSRTG